MKNKQQKKKLKVEVKFVKLWKRRLLDILYKDSSMHPKLRDYDFYTNGYATFSGKDNVSYYYTIDGYPKDLPVDFTRMVRGEIGEGVKISFISTFEPTRIDWNSPKMKSKLRVWRSIDEDIDDVDEFNYQENMEALDNNSWRKQSLLYLSDADRRRKRKFFRYRCLMIVTGVRGETFDKSIFAIQDFCKKIGVKVNRIEEDLFEYLRYYSPFSQEMSDKVLRMVGANTISDELLARLNTYEQGKIGSKGDYWGTDIASGYPVYKFMKKDSVDAENIIITAETGGGKSFFLKVLITQLIGNRRYNGTINDIEGFEYVPLANFVANQDSVVILNMAEGQGCYFDPVEINLTGIYDLDKDMYSFSRSFTLAVIKTLLGKELAQDNWAVIVVNNAVSKVYSNVGVNPKDQSTWYNSKGLTLFDVYAEFKVLYSECLSIVRRYGYSDNDTANMSEEVDLEIYDQYKRNKSYRKALDLVIAKLSAYFETLENGGIRSELFSERVTLEDIRRAKLVVNSFGMSGKDPKNIDPVQMSLAQLSASNISHIRSVFSKAEGKFNFKVWEEFQRWGSFPDADSAIKTALTGGRKLGDVNFIVTNDISEILHNDRFSIKNSITSAVIGAIIDSTTRTDLCNWLSIQNVQIDVDRIGTAKGKNIETFNDDTHVYSLYDKAFLVYLDKSVSTVVKMDIPDYIARSDIFRTGVDLSQ